MADVDAQGRVGMIVRDRPQVCIIELTRFHGPNVLSFDFVAGKRTHLIITYPPPYTLEHLLYLVEALKHFWDQNPIVLGELNANTQSQNSRNQQVSELLM